MNKIKEKLREELPKVPVIDVNSFVFFPGDRGSVILLGKDSDDLRLGKDLDALRLKVNSRSAYVRLTVEVFDGQAIENIIKSISHD